MGYSEMFKPDGTYIRFNNDDTIVIAKWAYCDKCEMRFDKGELSKGEHLWLCATCQQSE